jgi:bacillithiol system protein YtxJ
MIHSKPAEGVDYYLVDVIAERALSQEIASRFQEVHESPQLLIIRNGECTLNETHLSIFPSELNFNF